MQTITTSSPCQVTELIFVRYTISFRPGMVFCCSLKRMSGDYLRQVRQVYESENFGAALTTDDAKILTIQNGWR